MCIINISTLTHWHIFFNCYFMVKISIITSCFNREATIGQTIESVLSQDYADIEYIIVDGASRDRSLEIINSYQDCRIAKVISEPDTGMYEGINKGIKAATGDVIGLLHSDDFLFDNHVISTIAGRFEDTGADLVYGDGLFVDAADTDRVIRNWISGRYHGWKVRMGWLPLHPTVYVRKYVMERLGLYDESYKIASDSELLVRYLYKTKLRVEYLNRYILKMRMGGLSTDAARRIQMWKEDVRLYKEHGFWGVPEKLMKMGWKIPQFVEAKLKRSFTND